MKLSDLGQLFIIGLRGTALSEEEAEFIERNNIGGIILFKHNYESVAQLAELINSVQALRSEYPLFISVDHEGGRVWRFDDFTRPPPMYEISKLDSPKFCYEVHKMIADELNACGINLCFSPCCDIWTNPNNKAIGDRAFGDSEEVVSKFISSAIRGFQANNVISCAKHFPGHGDTTKDSHFDLPLIKHDLDSLKEREIKPFIKAAKSRVEMVMMGHLLVDSIDENYPTSLSSKAYELLRSELKYQRIIITDDMEMHAITKKYTNNEAAELAFNAGADILLYKSFDVGKEVFDHMSANIEQKESNIIKFKEKIKRVLECKKTNISEYSPVYIPGIQNKIGSVEAKKIVEEIEQKIQES